MKLNNSNNQIHLTVKSVTPFAIAKAPPLFTSSDLGVRFSTEISMTLIKPFFLLILVTLSISACGQSHEDKEHARKMERQAIVENSKNQLNNFAKKYSAVPIEPFGFSQTWMNTFTLTLQEKYEGASVAFRGTLLDIKMLGDGTYEALFGSRYISSTIINLSVPNSFIESLKHLEPKKVDFFVIARINKISPLILEASGCAEPDCTGITIEMNSFRDVFQITGKLVSIEEIDKT